MDNKLQVVLSAFSFSEKVVNIEKTGNGHINDTYKVDTDKKPSFLLQRINHIVFPCVEGLMNNINLVTCHLGKIIIKEGGNPFRETLSLIPTKEGKSFLCYEGNYYRLMRYIEDSVTVENPNLNEVYSAGNAFGLFIKRLWDFDSSKLFPVIENFHNTKKRLADFKQTLNYAKEERLKYAGEEIDFVIENEKLADSITSLIDFGKIGLHVTHNDTKINNILFDEEGKALAVVDLDTVMEGTPLYDFGDSIRSICNSAAEDEKNINIVHFKKDLFTSFAKGFIEVLGPKLNETEKASLTLGAIVMTYECGMRFLADYLNGNVYFKVAYDTHNLTRARTQFKLVSEMLGQKNELDKIVQNI